MPLTTIQQALATDASTFEGARVTCPAGRQYDSMTEGPACHCRIEGSQITAAKDPTSLAVFCMSNYEGCPTWRAEREHRLVSRSLVQEMERRSWAERAPKRGTLLDDEDARAFVVPGQL